MNTDTTKRYKVLKEIVIKNPISGRVCKIGTVSDYVYPYYRFEYFGTKSGHDTHFVCSNPEDYPEWFELVLPVSEPMFNVDAINKRLAELNGLENGLKEVLGWINAAINAKEKFPNDVDFDFTLKTLKNQTEQYLSSLNLNSNDTPIPSKLMERENTESPNQKGIDFCSTIPKAKPTNDDNAFIWTDELVMEFADTLPVYEMSSYTHINTFKQSKQSPPLSEIKEGKGWEIESYKYKNWIYKKNNLGEWSTSFDAPVHLLILHPENMATIHSVRRLKDNAVFSVGDEVGYDDGNTRTKKCWKIDNFFIRESDNVMLARGYDNINVEVVDKWLFKNNPPLPTTPAKPIVEETISTNNDDVAILSLNDLLSVWGSGENDNYNYKQAPLYKKFEKLANQKLKQ